jgi:hypothetical protein
MNLLSVLLALANLVIAISQESSNLIPVNHYARTRNSGEGRNLKDLGAIYNIPEPIVYYCDSSASFVLLFDVNVSPSYFSLSIPYSINLHTIDLASATLFAPILLGLCYRCYVQLYHVC